MVIKVKIIYSFIAKYYKILLVLLIVLFCNSCVLVKIHRLSKAKLESLSSNQIIDYQNKYGLIIVPVTINGQRYNFVFDTGAETTAISKKLANKLKLKSLGSIATQGVRHITHKLQIVRINAMLLDRISYTNVSAVITNFNKNLQFKCFNIDGILGENVIRLTNWKIDFKNKTIVILDKRKAFKPGNSAAIPFEIKGGLPHISLTVNNVRSNFVVDLGNNAEEVNISSKISLGKPNYKTIGLNAVGLFTKNKIDTLKIFKVKLSDNSSTFVKNNVISSQSVNGRSNMGIGFLKKYCSSVSFDFKQNIIYLNEKDIINSKAGKFVFSPMLVPNAVVVGTVKFGFSKFNIGDTILSVNGMHYENANVCKFMNELINSIKQNKNLKLEIKHNKIIKSFSLSYR